MSYQIDRRQWLKTSVAAAASLALNRNNLLGKAVNPPQSKTSLTSGPIRLHSNESPYGISGKARQAIYDSLGRAHLYPHRQYIQLKNLIAKQEMIPPESIILGAGSTEIMTTLIHLYCNDGSIMVTDPTYFDFIYYAEKTGSSLIKIPLDDKFTPDFPAMEKKLNHNISLIYLCNPINPTATIASQDKLRAFCTRASEKALVVVDEAYYDYVENDAYASMIDLVRKNKNIIVMRTFSKIYGMAGLRVGYGMAPLGIIEKLKKIERNFAPITYPSLKAAEASYQDEEFCRTIREKNKIVKKFFVQELAKRGYSILPSDTNFVLFKIDYNGEELVDRFRKENILIRSFYFKECHWMRISLGTIEEMKVFLHIFDRIIK